MLDLASPHWASLTHAYGEASDVPELLAQLRTAPVPADYRDEPWFSLWSSLCHQNDVYTASYAAVPHIITIAGSRPAKERFDHLHFAGWVEVCRHRKNSPAIPEDLHQAYQAALKAANDLVLENLKLDWDEEHLRALLGCLAVFRGYYRVGATIIDLSGEEVCPNCGTYFDVRGYELFENQ